MLISPLAAAGLHVTVERAAAICAYVPVNPSFAAEYEEYPEIKEVPLCVAASVPFVTSALVMLFTNLTVT